MLLRCNHSYFNPVVRVGLEQDFYEVREDAGEVRVGVNLYGPGLQLGRPLVVRVSIEDETAQGKIIGVVDLCIPLIS